MPCYFFSGDKFIRVTRGQVGAGAIDPGYPHSISDWGWGEFGAHGIDAAMSSGPVDYFFSGSRFIRVTRGETGVGVVDAGYPKSISHWGWGEFGAHGIDAALYSDTKCYFFAGEHYIRVSRGDVDPGQIDSGYPAPISDWGWGEFGAHGIDAALNSGAFSYFFAGDHYIRVSRGDVGRGRIDSGYPAPISDWGWGPFGASGISAALFSGIDFDDPAPEPHSGLGSNSNYIFSGDCKPLLDVTVTIDLTQHIALLGNGPPSDDLSSVSGYGWQLNCFSPTHETDVIQQYVIQLVDGHLYGTVNNWKNAHEALVNQWQLLLFFIDTVPAHWKLRIALRNDDPGNVTGVTFTVRNGEGETVAESDMALTDIGVPAHDLAPIVAFELDFVGPANGESAELFLGAGTITYTARSELTAMASRPPCAESDLNTEETANTVYGLLPPNPATWFQQSFKVAPPGFPAIRREGRMRPPLIMRGPDPGRS
jgi:Hemopexin